MERHIEVGKMTFSTELSSLSITIPYGVLFMNVPSILFESWKRYVYGVGCLVLDSVMEYWNGESNCTNTCLLLFSFSRFNFMQYFDQKQPEYHTMKSIVTFLIWKEA